MQFDCSIGEGRDAKVVVARPDLEAPAHARSGTGLVAVVRHVDRDADGTSLHGWRADGIAEVARRGAVGQVSRLIGKVIYGRNRSGIPCAATAIVGYGVACLAAHYSVLVMRTWT